MVAFLILGFFLGIKHALEADHVAAVASLATRSSGLANTARVAGAWGVGHAAAILLFGSVLLALDVAVPAGTASLLEGTVGVVLVLLGIDVLRRLRQRRVHVHVHEHDGVRHVHAHAHADEKAHDATHHQHAHVRGLLPRAILVGGVHGLAGTAALTLLSLQALHSVTWGLVYLALFGLGSILGMVLLSIAISFPLRWASGRLNVLSTRLEAALGGITIALGGWITVQSLIAGMAAS